MENKIVALSERNSPKLKQTKIEYSVYIACVQLRSNPHIKFVLGTRHNNNLTVTEGLGS